MNDLESGRLPRREFIALGSATLFSSILVEPRASWLDRPSPPASGPAPVFVGYWLGSESLPRLDLFAWSAAEPSDHPTLPSRVIPAEALTEADPGLLEGAVDLEIYGLFPQASHCRGAELEFLSFRVRFHHSDPIDVHAWSLSRWRGVLSASSSVRMRVPVDAERGIHFSGDVRGPADPSTVRSFQVRLGSRPGQPKLRRGVYLIRLPPRDGSLRAGWERYAMRPRAAEEPGPAAQLCPRGGPHDEPLAPDFAYVLLSIDRASIGLPGKSR